MFRFRLVLMQQNSALFMTLMPGFVHGAVDASFSIMIGTYLVTNGLLQYVQQCHSGGGIYQPDVRIVPAIPDPAGPYQDLDQDYGRPFSRVVIEFEFGNRNASAIRQVGFPVLSSNDYRASFVGIKVWKKTVAGVFCAVAVVWENDRGTEAVSVRQALDFGTKPLSTQTKDAWSHDAGANMLPPVPVGSWLRPPPMNAVTTRLQSVKSAKKAMFYRMPSTDAKLMGVLLYTSPMHCLHSKIV